MKSTAEGAVGRNRGAVEAEVGNRQRPKGKAEKASIYGKEKCNVASGLDSKTTVGTERLGND